MKINKLQALKLFDERHPEHEGLATSIIGMIGEDLGAGAFKKYRASKKTPVKVIEYKFQAIGFPSGHGPRWDRWFVDERKKVLYQCEIKSFCSYATNGTDVRKKGIEITSKEYWKKLIKAEFIGQGKYGKTSKVLIKMKCPNGYDSYNIEPLLILWWPVSTDGNLSPFFRVNVSSLGVRFKSKFKKLNIFSVSLYLREVRGTNIAIEMPNVKKRLRTLHQIVK